MRNLIGQQLGNYQLISVLGRGGFAEVYLGEHSHLKTQVAIKVLHTSLEGEEVEKFRQEAQTVAHLKHPHIVKVFDFDVEDHIPFLVMDFFSKGNLRQHHPRGVPLPLPTIIEYVKQVASALQYAHEQQIIHRDIKPENMLLSQNNEIALVDFGVALLSQSSRSHSAQEIAGTITYMAPEQFQGRPRRASDQYALAVVVYEWISGHPPFSGSFSEIASQHLFMKPPSLCENLSTLPLAVEEVVMKALTKDPERRFKDIQSFAMALELASYSTPNNTVQNSTVYYPHAFAAPDQFSQRTEAIALLPSSFTPVPDKQEDETSVQPALSASSPDPAVPPNPSSLLLATLPLANTPTAASSTIALLDQPAVTPEVAQPQEHTISRRVMTAGLLGLAGIGTLGGGIAWLMRENNQKPIVHSGATPTHTHSAAPVPIGTTLYTYYGHSQAQYGVYAAVWSPSGKRIASSAGTVHVWDAADGGHVYTHHSSVNNYANSQEIAWSPDGTRLASIENIPIEVWGATNGVHLATHQSSLGWMQALAWAPDNKRIVSGSDKQPGSVEIWDVTSGNTILTYLGHTSPVQSVAWSPNGKWIVSSSMGKDVHVWDATSGTLIHIYPHPVNHVQSVAWSPDSKRIASAGKDGTVHVWNASDGGNTSIYQGHFNASDTYHSVTTVAWSPNGKLIASGDWNHKVQIWDATSGKPLYTYRGHTDYINWVAWSPDGTRIASTGRDATVRVWQAS